MISVWAACYRLSLQEKGGCSLKPSFLWTDWVDGHAEGFLTAVDVPPPAASGEEVPGHDTAGAT
jgi:hypothetical protein